MLQQIVSKCHISFNYSWISFWVFCLSIQSSFVNIFKMVLLFLVYSFRFIFPFLSSFTFLNSFLKFYFWLIEYWFTLQKLNIKQLKKVFWNTSDMTLCGVVSFSFFLFDFYFVLKTAFLAKYKIIIIILIRFPKNNIKIV